jgi:hypothetical protein
MRRVVFALCLGFATAATAQQPPPPDPAFEAAILKTSCPAGDEPAKPDTVTVRAEPVPLSALEGSHDQVGKLVYIAGAKLTSDDPRFGDIIGLQFDAKLGFVAATASGNWILFDAFGPSLLDFKSVKIAPMRGAVGQQTALARIGQSFVVASHDGHGLDRYELNTCGPSAHAASVGGLQSSDHIVGIAPATASYTLLAGVDSTDARHDLVSRGFQPGMKLGDSLVPGLAGYELINVAGPQVVVPYDMIALWRRAGGGTRTRVQSFSMPSWSDNRALLKAPPSAILADLPLSIRAVTGYYDGQNRLLRLWMVSQAGPKEPTYLLAFAAQSVTG